MEKTIYEEPTESKRQNLRKSMEKLKADTSEVITYTHQLKGLRKHFDSVEAHIEKRSRELELQDNELQSLSLYLGQKIKTFEAQKSKAGDLKKLVEECNQELTAKLDSSARVQKDLESMNEELRKVKAMVLRLCNEGRKLVERNKGIKEETTRKTKDWALVLDQIEESSTQLATLDEQLESRQKLLEIRSLELVSTENLLGRVRGNIMLSNNELELKEKMVESLNNVITDCGKTIDLKSRELGEIQKLIEQQTNELGVLNNQSDTIKLLIQVLSEELVAKEKTHKEILETICTSSSEMEERAKEIKAAETEVSDLNVRSEMFRQDVEGREKELDLLKNQIESEGQKLIQLEREMEEETDRKKRDLELVLSKIEESGKQLAAVDEQLVSQLRVLETQSVELVFKEIELECMRESIKIFDADLKLKEKMVESLDKRVTVYGKTIDSKSEELEGIQKLIEQQTNELEVLRNEGDSTRLLIQELSEELVAKEKRNDEILETICRNSSEMEEEKASKTKDLALILNKIEESGNQLATVDEQLESRQRLLESHSLELVSKEKELGRVRDSIKLSNSDLELKEKMVQSLNKRVTVCGKTIDSKSEELGEIQKLIEQQTNELGALCNQRDSIRLSIQELSKDLVAKEMELECVGESSKRFEFDLEVKEKRFQALNSLITISGEQLDLKSKELEEIQRELELKKRLRQKSTVFVKHEKQPAAAPINDTSQQNAAETEPVDEDALMHHELSASLTCHEASSELRALRNPAEFVLELVQEHISEELNLQDSVLEIFVLLFEELMEIQPSHDSQLEPKATQVAVLWKEKITIETPKSSLEVLAFLLFIVAYGLQKLITKEETALLAWTIAQYEHASTLFNSLGLKLEIIPEIVENLITKRQYIAAVWLICLFKLKEKFSPSDLLMKEIINLRQSALKKRLTESSQAKDKDAARLGAILELVADYKLEVNLPGDLIAKLMIQRENSAPLVRCSVEEHGTTSSSNPQANSPDPASVQRSSVNLRAPKPEVEPYLNPSDHGRS
ncbi:FRIGIDA-like protein 1 [Cardamine amara subsp. amara]|uniref:FRIGIDA-like protein 1 n=1 Tax=Cardamine amara subsp. amara TaxID=228776 RepID=A0ABD1AY45_CARAN